MNTLRLTALLAMAALWAAGTRAEERNGWPVRVTEFDAAGRVESERYAGPLIYRQPAEDNGAVAGLRPVYAKWTDSTGALREFDFLYPVFVYRTNGDWYRWSIFELINKSGGLSGTTSADPKYGNRTFDVWPFWFSRNTGEAEGSYQALFPIAGTIKNRFGYDRLSWGLFPVYGRSEKKDAVATSVIWPIFRVRTGAVTGWQVWPLYSVREKPGAFNEQFFLWPLGWNNTYQHPDAPAGTPPRREVALLPFYSRETDTGLINESYLWPFFGYTDRTAKPAYHEIRYFWPFLVQGHGDEKEVHRWGPFYTHSVIKGEDKRWVMWPLYRQATWADGRVTQTRTQFLYFFLWSEEQRSRTNPNAAPAEKTHLWPLFSAWDNGAGRKQVQFPSPIEVFFQGNPQVQANWSPLFALYRYDQRAPDDQRYEVLWGLLTWRREPERKEFHLGPLFSVDEQPAGKRIAIGNGLVGLKRGPAGTGWRLFWFDFHSKANKLNAASR